MTTRCNKNNANTLILKTMLMVLSSWQSHFESSSVHLINVEHRHSISSCKSACRLLSSTPTTASITRPETWYSFHHPPIDRRLIRPRHCSKGAQGCIRILQCFFKDSQTGYREIRSWDPQSSVRNVTTRPLRHTVLCSITDLCEDCNDAKTVSTDWRLRRITVQVRVVRLYLQLHAYNTCTTTSCVRTAINSVGYSWQMHSTEMTNLLCSTAERARRRGPY